MPLWATLAAVAVFAAVAAGFSLRWRGDLREGVLRREAESLHAILQLKQASGGPRLAEFGLDVTNDLFTAVIESAGLRGVMRARLFDPAGNLRHALPSDPGRKPLAAELLARAHGGGQPFALYHESGDVAAAMDMPQLIRSRPERAPLMEAVVPMRDVKSGALLGIAHYWMDGARMKAEFAALDRGLAWQVGVLVLIGGVGIGAISAVALRRLAAANRQLAEQGEDLSRANRELVLAAKTSAVGAISAHLIHGLKSPIAGLEGFIADGSAANGAVHDGEAWREATETTRRLRNLINDVVGVLRDEAAAAKSQVALRDVVDEVLHRYAGEAERIGVQLTASAQEPTVTVDGRVANLAGLVLANLLGNAIEASPRGGEVKIEAAVSRDEISFKVMDRGPGLPPEVRRQLFRPLRSTKRGGSGIGLAISQQLARHVGGRVELVSSSDEGTIFRFVVPQG